MRSDYVPYKSTIKMRVTEVKPNISFNLFPSLQLEEEEVEKVVQKVSSRQQSHSTYPAHLLSVL